MIRMSLDKDAVLPQKLSPAFATAVGLSEQPQVGKPRPLPPKNGFHVPSNSSGSATQRAAKRRYSVGAAFKGLTKRRRRTTSDCQSEPRLPSHFLLGGNIFDPLNLNSLLDEEVNKATNQETPQSSPLPSRGGDPIEILVPRDITDPLNLKGGGKEGRGEDGVLLSPLKSRKRHRNRHHGGGGSDREVLPARLFPSASGPTASLLTAGGSVSTSPLSCELNTAITCREDVAPPPILPRRHTHPPAGGTKQGSQREGRHRRRHRTASARPDSVAAAVQPTKFQTPLVGGAKGSRCGDSQRGSTQPPQRKKDKHRYRYGQYSCYYGYHGFYGDAWEGRVGAQEDPRLQLLEADWFRDKRVLDVGCGAGHLTLAIARRFNPAHILGVELDERLVHAAKQNVRHFLSHDLAVEERKGLRAGPVEEGGGRALREEQQAQQQAQQEVQQVQQALSLLPSFPVSLRVSRGPLCAPRLSPSSSSSRFPHNVTFIQGNYVSVQQAWPGRGQYDVIVCLGVTKWVHLHSGDVGVVRLFTRAFHSLTPGGLLVLEPQPWSSYNRSKRASERTFHHFRRARLKPEQFTSYLTESVGFSSYRLLTHAGNQRPVYLFYKGPAQRK